MPGKVLLLDEDKQVQANVGEWLKQRGFEASVANNCGEAEQLARQERFGLVIVDMRWPCLDGVQTLTRLRQLLPDADLVAVSEFADRELEEAATRNGAGWFLTKPLNLDELEAVLASPGQGEVRPESGFLPGNQIAQTLLRGFNPDEQWDFRMTGSLRNWQAGQLIPLNEEASSLVWIEQGGAGAFVNGVPVDSLAAGDFWGEENFVNPSAPTVQLLARENCQVRHFSRRRLLDFFAYHDETLTKRYMINLILCLQLKWKRNLLRLSKSSVPGSEQETP
jgi:CheY-like chemotaxis protein